MTQLALMSKKFFSSHYMLNGVSIPALKVFSKFYKLILASGFKKRLQRSTMFPPFCFSPLFLRFFFITSESTQNKRYTGYAYRLSQSILEIHYKFRRERSTNAKKKRGREGDTEIHRGSRKYGGRNQDVE
jgi:hypothetical protein